MKNDNNETHTPEKFVAYKYMTNSKTIREGLFKVPLIQPDKIINKRYFDLQKSPDTPPKRLLAVEDRKKGFDSVAFKGLTFQRTKQYDWKNGVSTKFKYLPEEEMEKWTAYSILTGSINNLVVIDLDCMKNIWIEKQNQHPFIVYYNNLYNLEPHSNYLISIETIIIKMNTYSVKTQSGGYHIYFKTDYAGSFPSTASPSLEIDIRGDGGLIVGAYSRIYDMEGNKKDYKPFTDIEVGEMEIIHSDFINKVYEKTTISKNRKDKSTMKKYQNIKINPNLYSFYVDDELLKDIEEKLPLSFFNSGRMEYLKLTAFYKKIDRKKEWDIISKKHNGYNYTTNLDLWETANIDINCVEYVLKKIGKLHYLNYIKYKDLIHNKINPDTIVNSEGKKGLSEVLNIEQGKNYIIKSGTATGKTYAINEYIHKYDHKLLSITSRTTLAKEHQRVFGSWYDKTDPVLSQFDNYILYSEHRNEYLGVFEGDNMIIQIDSIEKISNWDFTNYVVYVDELNSVFEYLMSSTTLSSKRRNVYSLFNKICSECKQFIGTDADISDLCLYWLNPDKYLTGLLPNTISDFTTQSPNINCEYIKNTHNHYQGVKATELFSYGELIEEIKKEQKFMVCCDSATEARNLRNKLQKDDKKNKYEDCIVIDRLYGDKDENDLDNIHQVIFSPKIVYGLDSQMERKVFCLFKGHTIPAKSMLQQIARCRNQEHLYYYFMDKKQILKQFEFNNTDEVVDKVKYLDRYINSYFKTQIEREEIEAINIGKQSFYNYLIGFYLYNLDADCSNKFYHFRNGLKNIGYNIISNMKMSEDVNKKLSIELNKLTKDELLTHFKQNKEDQYYQRINDIIKLPDTKDYDRYIEIFTKPEKLQQHLNYCNLYLKDTTIKDLTSEYKNKEFATNVSLGDTNKINWLKDLIKLLNMEFGSLKPTQSLSSEDAKKYKAEYLTLFRFQGDKVKLDFGDKYKLSVIIKSSMDMLCGDLKKDDFVSPYKSVKFKEGKGKDRKQITTYEIDLQSQAHLYHKSLFLYRINKNNHLNRAFKNYHKKIDLTNIINNFKENCLNNK